MYCPDCDNFSSLNMKNIDKTNVNKECCIHTFVAKILMEMSDPISLDVVDRDNICVVQENPCFVAVVYPKEKRYDSKTRPLLPH